MREAGWKTCRHRSMVWAAGALLGAALIAGCGTGEESNGAAKCADVIRYNGGRYSARLVSEVPVGRRLGDGERPACDDGGGDPTSAFKVTVYQVPGVDPTLAVSLGSGSDSVYVSESAKPDDVTSELRQLLE